MRSSRIGTATVVGCSTRSSHAARSADPWRFSPREAARRRSSAWLAALLSLTIVHAAPTPAAGDAASAPAADLAARFVHPPDSARPWVYWFWNNGNVTREGITADLEAMRRVGIGGVILMDVVERFAPPKGPATFMGDVWRGDFQFALAEAARLGLEVNMTNAAGWCGSSGPWITPELSMQKLVVTETTIDGPARFDAVLPKLPPVTTRPGRDVLNSSVSTGNFYGPVAVLAFPATGDGVVPRGSVLDLAARTDDAGRLRWDVPPGKWVVQRIGHVSTGSSTRPPVLGGNGLECDKLSAAAMDLHFAHLIGRLKADAGPSAGRALVATHIDSWEVGSQNWTDDLPAEFQRRRGYSLLPFLPAYALNGKRQIDSKAMGDRFRWDFYQTISDLLAQNYSGRLATLAHGRGMRLTIEGYDLPFGDEATYTAASDEPMTEFWTNPAGPNATKALEMASVAHVYGRPVVGAEAFTSNAKEEWRLYPAVLKAEGDSYLAQGVNRFVFHRYAFQPWLDRAPGSTMGPWGLHYERTNTWWDMSGPWHAYLARCQYLLRQGRYVADVLYLRPQYPNLGTYNPVPPLPAGYRSDQISATALMDRVTVRDGRLALPDGMSYRLLVLPPVAEVTPELAEKVRDLVMAGATVLGPRPTHSPSLSDYPRCDQRVADVARALWGDAGAAPVDRAVGAGRVLSGVPLEAALRATGTGPDLTCAADVHWIHRRIGTTDVYFVANPNATAIDASLAVRSPNGRVERWDPQTGGRTPLQATAGPEGVTRVPLQLGPTDSCFVVLLAPDAGTPPPAEPVGLLSPVTNVPGPWDIKFPPGLGAPPQVHVDHLASLSESADEGVRHFSGTATYTATFTASPLVPGQRAFLDLGNVQVMARVTLNGADVGIAWRPPYRLEVTGTLRPGENKLEVAVADLWPNRLIGDAPLPAKDRVGWSTWEPFKADMPLLPSGLIGPVRLMTGPAPRR